MIYCIQYIFIQTKGRAMEQLHRLTCPVCGGQLALVGEKQFKCKYCLEIFELKEELTNDDIINLNRAETERRRFLFDDALDSYEQVLEKHPKSEVALWGAFLCEYGVEYVKDYDNTFKPTCHRASEKPVSSSSYYKRLPESYKQKALVIEEIRKEIIAQMQGLDKYDIFICYKSKLEDGKTPTKESKLGYNVYNELYRERPKLKVFFADETLSLHNANYEPQIFNALKTAKLMIVIGATLENVKAPWVKNEWKRFYEMSKKDKSKVIRVVYQDIEPYDFPRELQGAQMIDNDSGRTLAQVLLAVDEIFKVAQPVPVVEPISIVTPQPIAPQPKPTPVAQPTVPEKPQPKPAAPKPSAQTGPQTKVTVQNVVYELKGKEYHVVQSPDATGDIVIQDSIEGLPVTVIENNAFKDIASITKVTIGSKITVIGDLAFSGCKALESVNIPNGVTSIGYGAFYNCVTLKILTIPQSVKTLGNSAFSSCKKLKEINFNAIAMKDLSGNNNAFAYVGDAKGVKVTIGKNVTKIPAHLFCPDYNHSSHSPSITSVEFEEGSVCKSIGEFAFCNCVTLTSITIPQGIKYIGKLAFISCTAITQINFNAIEMENLSDKNNVFSCVGQEGIGVKVIIGKNVTKIPAYLFSSSGFSGDHIKITSVEFEEGSVCTSIGDAAFSGCKVLTSIEISNSVTSIGSDAFSGCYSLTSVTIGANVTSIGSGAFSACRSLTSITIGENVESIGDCAFSFCTALTNIVIPNSVTSIGNVTFNACYSLTSVTIGANVKSIGIAFCNCSSLSNVIFKEINGWTHKNKKLSGKLFTNQKKLIKFLTKKQKETMQRG